MNRLASFCQQLQFDDAVRKNFQASTTDKVIKDKMLDLSKETNTLDTAQRGKAFASLCGTPNG